MTEMTSRERYIRMYQHREADRIPIVDNPWQTTIARWHREGMPQGMSFVDFFGLDRVVTIDIDNSPRYPVRVLEETDDYVISTSLFGVTMKQWKHTTSTPEFLDFTIVNPGRWQAAKERITPTLDRVDWDYLKAHYRTWKEQGAWIRACLWFGFDVTHAWIVGTERVLIALIEDPEWLMDMFGHLLETQLTLLDKILQAGYEIDCLTWPDDMGYKHNQFFSLSMYRRLLKPFHKRAIDWAHARGLKTHLHSCGDVNPFVPELVEMGLDALNPLEVKAGMDPVYLKKTFGDRLVLHGGINALLWDQPEQIREEMERVVPVMKESGGYIFSSDHSVPSNVSLEDFRRIVDLAKKLGSY